MKLVSVWNPKGGQGKSMLAINLAGACVEIGLKPIIICQDPQGTSMLYYRNKKLNFSVISKIPDKKPDADIIFFDHQASDWDVPNNKVIVMPLKPSRDQYATYIDAFKRAESLDKTIITIVTDGQFQRTSERNTANELKNNGAFVIPSSGVFSKASEEYLTIYDKKLNGSYKINERRKDIQKILAKILLEVEN